jgi:hypothetical protein
MTSGSVRGAQIYPDGVYPALGGQLGQVFGEVPGSGEHAHTLADQCPGHGQADALARSGDDSHLACQSKVHGLHLLSSEPPPREQESA